MDDQHTQEGSGQSEADPGALSQQEPQQDSNLQTPQADQPIPSDPEPAQEAQPVQDQSAPEPYQPKHRPLENAGLDQEAAEADRQAELQEQREEHNRRTDGVHDGSQDQ